MTPQYRAALLRGLLIGLLAGALTALTTWSNTNDVKTIAIAAGTAFLAPLIVRAGGEGMYDSRRQDRGVQRPGDVTAQPRD